MKTRSGTTTRGAGGKASQRRLPRQSMSMPMGPPAPPPAATVTPEMIAFRTAAKAQAESAHNGAIDENMRREMVLATSGLSPRADATHVAVQDGDWTDETTWLNNADDFEVPTTNAKILVPSTITVTMDNNATTSYSYLRLDGDIEFITDGNTQLNIDFICVDHMGSWTQGTSVAPIPAAYTSTITFPDPGDINTTVDTLLIGRGMVAMGEVSIYGAAKTPWVTCHQERSVGATTLTLNEAPAGWQTGDEITVCSTRLRGWTSIFAGFNSPESDDTTVSAISGTALTLGNALAYPRSLATVRADAKFSDAVYYVGNYSRNITFRSPPGTAVHRRGHLMFMQPANVAYADSRLMGRTRKDIESIDATNDARMNTIYGTGARPANANVRGRYNWHWHRAGVGAQVPVFSEALGLAASDSPGWAYAHHSSYLNVTECVGRRWFGTGLMAEVGNEVGTWTRCLMQSGYGRGNPSDSAEKDIALVFLNGLNTADLGLYGTAYWGRSRVVEMEDCVAADCSGYASWMSRGNIFAPFVADIDLNRIFFGQIGGGPAATSSIADKPVLHVRGARAISCNQGIVVVKANPSQTHTHRSILFDCMFVFCRSAIQLEYTGKYTMQKFRIWIADLVGDSNRAAAQVGQGTVDMVFWDYVVRNCSREGIRVNSGGNVTSGPYWDNTFIDIDYQGVGPTFLLTGNGPLSISDYEDRTIINPTVHVRDLEWTPSAEPFIADRNDSTNYRASGTLTESIRSQDRARYFTGGGSTGSGVYIRRRNIEGLLSERGYWTYSGSKYVLVPDVLTDSLMTVAGEHQTRLLTMVLRIGSAWDGWISMNGIVNRGALGASYVSAITGSTWRVYEDVTP